MSPNIEPFFDAVTGTMTYIVYDEPGGTCAIIDPVLDYDLKAARTSTSSADKLISFVKTRRLPVEWVEWLLETHVHADHLTSAHYLKKEIGGKTGIGWEIPRVQQIFKEMFNYGTEFVPDGWDFDHLFTDLETFKVGKLGAQAISTSGHTPADMWFRLTSAPGNSLVLKRMEFHTSKYR